MRVRWLCTSANVKPSAVTPSWSTPSNGVAQPREGEGSGGYFREVVIRGAEQGHGPPLVAARAAAPFARGSCVRGASAQRELNQLRQVLVLLESAER
jgi:hypothetical protein